MTEPARSILSSRQVIQKAIPLEKANIHNANKAANTDLLAADIIPSTLFDKDGTSVTLISVFRIFVMLPAAGKFTAKLTKSGSNELTIHFNAATNLTALALYAFDLPMHAADAVNFQSDAIQNGHYLRVQEIIWAVQ